jgi:hypothetical protein
MKPVSEVQREEVLRIQGDVGFVMWGRCGLALATTGLKPDSISALHHWPESKVSPPPNVEARTTIAAATLFHIPLSCFLSHFLLH